MNAGVPPITIVSGLPRSGTSLMMQMLSAGGMPVLSDGFRTADEDNPRGYLEYEPVKRSRQDSSWVAAAPGKAVKVVHLLLPDLPANYAYQVILMRRPVQEILKSQRAMLDRAGRRGAAIPADLLARAFEQQLSQLGAWLANQQHFRAIEIEYRECVFNSPSAAASVNRFLGGSLDEGAMAAVPDSSLYRQRFS
ncbi:MAG TPA: hypothetical protein VFW83_01555 [Bryobacteraceae bacterium]|nr:hypothetical protein [Bryobacteraceae bacterium]